VSRLQELGLDQTGARRGWGLTLFAFALAFVASIVSVGALRRLLLAMEMVDHPGQRRLHHAPIPRGGGLGIVGAAMSVMLLASTNPVRSDLLSLNVGLLLVAGIGWWDDRRGLGIAPRLLVHALAGAAVWWWLAWHVPIMTPAASLWGGLSLIAVTTGVVVSINLHNFIDGANGLLGIQALFVLAMLSVLALNLDPGLSFSMACSAGAIAGFLPWNFPKARIFLGDVGSGAIGFLLAVFTLWALMTGSISLLEAALVHSLVLIDGLCTLAFRMYSGRRWWRAHREHLYQWLVRSGHSHARVVIVVQGWNLIMVLPLMLWLNGHPRNSGPSGGAELVAFDTGLEDPTDVVLVAAVFAVGVYTWWTTKRRLLRAHRAKWRYEKKYSAGTFEGGSS